MCTSLNDLVLLLLLPVYSVFYRPNKMNCASTGNWSKYTCSQGYGDGSAEEEEPKYAWRGTMRLAG